MLHNRGRNVFHAGMARTGHALGSAAAGDVAAEAMASGKGNYLANLLLYPGESGGVVVNAGLGALVGCLRRVVA
jgi:hypothetical protein